MGQADNYCYIWNWNVVRTFYLEKKEWKKGWSAKSIVITPFNAVTNGHNNELLP